MEGVCSVSSSSPSCPGKCCLSFAPHPFSDTCGNTGDSWVKTSHLSLSSVSEFSGSHCQLCWKCCSEFHGEGPLGGGAAREEMAFLWRRCHLQVWLLTTLPPPKATSEPHSKPPPAPLLPHIRLCCDLETLTEIVGRFWAQDLLEP